LFFFIFIDFDFDFRFAKNLWAASKDAFLID